MDDMSSTIHSMIEAKKILDACQIPTEGRAVWITKESFLALGNSEEDWVRIAGDDDIKLFIS